MTERFDAMIGGGLVTLEEERVTSYRKGAD